MAPAPLNGSPAPPYISQLASLGWKALRDYSMPAAPVPLLLLLLRNAALRQYFDSAMELLTSAGAAEPTEKLEPELVGISTVRARPSAWDLMQRDLPGRGPVGAFLDGAKEDSTIPNFANYWSAFAKLSGFSAEALDFATREVLDLASYRFDAWATSLAHVRLDETRRVAPNGGIVLGGYGWLEDVRPSNTQAASAGYIHAPSLAHATTAAVLRSGYLSHRDGSQQPFQVDLTSDRVRLGLHLLDGIREGQPLGALLGYRLERTMHDSGLDNYIDVLRRIAHVDGADSDAGASESVAANNVVDGLALLRKFREDPQFWSNPDLPPPGNIRDSIASAVGRMDAALDAVADLSLAESVHQLLRGNTIRAGATLDAIARGDTVPPELEVIRTPKVGTSLTHRLLAMAVGNDAPGWPTTSRSRAEPRLNSLVATLLGNPAKVRARARFVDKENTILATGEISLEKLGLAPLDFLGFPENDGTSGELAERLRREFMRARPQNASTANDVQLIAERDSSWTPDVISISEWLGLLKAISRMVGSARPVLPSDLVLPGQTAGDINRNEIQQRADSAESELRSVRQAFNSPGGIEAALLSAAGFGISGVIPRLDSSQWTSQATVAVNELDKRLGKLDDLASGFDRTHASSDASLAQDVGRLRIVFGDSFVVLPTFANDLAATWPTFWNNSASLQDGDRMESIRWFQRTSRVRPGVARLDRALLCAEVLAGRSLVHFDLAQFPFTNGDRWLALELSNNSPHSRLSLVAFTPTPYVQGAPIAGLLIDEWTEVIPSAKQTTAISFHHDDPTARAPQAILVAVRPDDFPEWTLETVEGSILETLSLAKFRAVDPDTLDGLGHYLPALYFAFNTGAPTVETISTDFTVAWKTALTTND